jgi:hypothetical protein
LRASVNGANVVIITILSTIVCEDTSCLRIARFVSARILVITNNSIMVNSSSCSITPVGCASVVVVNVDRSENTESSGLIATVCGARIVIITRNRCLNNSCLAIASNMYARITVVKSNWNVLAAQINIT